jgi:hypothetical protein
MRQFAFGQYVSSRLSANCNGWSELWVEPVAFGIAFRIHVVSRSHFLVIDLAPLVFCFCNIAASFLMKVRALSFRGVLYSWNTEASFFNEG